MKKLKFFSCLLFAIITFANCKNGNNFEVGTRDETEAQLASLLPEQYADIGKEHNRILSDFYFGKKNNRSSIADYKAISIEDYFGEFNETYYFKDIKYTNSRNISNAENITDSLVENKLITEENSIFISEVEKILDQPFNSLEETQNAISKIEIDVLSSNSNKDLYEFISYAETAKSSLEFWTENIDELEQSKVSNYRSIFNFWKKYKHKIGMMAASDAAGAATGAGIGALLGAEILGPTGSAIGAAIGAAVVGTASSAKGFQEDKVCVVISYDELKKKIQKRN